MYNLTNIFKKFDKTHAFRTNNRTQDRIFNSSSINKRDKFTNSGVYKFQCSSCSSHYIGQTGRNFNIRYTEHVKALKFNRYSAIAQHMRETGHAFTHIDNDLGILHTAPKGLKLNSLESQEIFIHHKREPDNLLNETTPFETPLLRFITKFKQK